MGCNTSTNIANREEGVHRTKRQKTLDIPKPETRTKRKVKSEVLRVVKDELVTSAGRKVLREQR